MEKFYNEDKCTKEFEITGSNGKKIMGVMNTYYVFGDLVMFGDLVSSRSVTFLEYEIYIDAFKRKFKKNWPPIRQVVKVDQNNDAILLEDYIEIGNYDEGYDNNVSVTSMFYYISFDGKILTDAYILLTGDIVSLNCLREKEQFPDFDYLYNKTKKKIARNLQDTLTKRYKNLNMKTIKELILEKSEK